MQLKPLTIKVTAIKLADKIICLLSTLTTDSFQQELFQRMVNTEARLIKTVLNSTVARSRASKYDC